MPLNILIIHARLYPQKNYIQGLTNNIFVAITSPELTATS
jgi:hypothetical protein